MRAKESEFEAILEEAAINIGDHLSYNALACAVESAQAMKGRTLEEIVCGALIESDEEVSLLAQLLILSKAARLD